MLAACGRPQPAPPQPAVYHWQQQFGLEPSERQWLAGFGCQTIYLRFFDLDLDHADGRVVPFSVMQPEWPTAWEGEIIPTVFITNRSLHSLRHPELDSLAARILRKIDHLAADCPPLIRWQEIQIDCDWTESTRDAYFYLLEQLRLRMQARNQLLSATIRLHQIKYADRTGVPPVDRGMLMFYNMDNVRDSATRNSILDLQVARQYLYGFDKYPLPLDLALPLFSWAVWQREHKTVGLLYPFDPTELADTTRVRQRTEQRFELRKSTYLDGRYLYAGDRLRVENVQPDTLRQAVSLLRTELPPIARRVAFFALDPPTVKAYSHEFLVELLTPPTDPDPQR